MTTTISPMCKKRLIGDIKLIRKEPLEFIETVPDDSDLLTWYFLIKGPASSDFQGGYYIGKIIHNPEYPMKPPDFMMLTPNGRFAPDKKICLSNTGYHTDEWSPMWNINAILVGFLSIMLDDTENGISHIHSSKNERKIFAVNSIEFNKKHYKNIVSKFTRLVDENGNPKKPKDNKTQDDKTQDDKENKENVEFLRNAIAQVKKSRDSSKNIRKAYNDIMKKN